MSAMNQVMSIHRRSEFGWGPVRQSIIEWRQRARSRNDLADLSDQSLQDIGVSRCTANFEAAKPFWMA
jgi:uncharacterized protein YjiS (DUF1127 family)